MPSSTLRLLFALAPLTVLAAACGGSDTCADSQPCSSASGKVAEDVIEFCDADEEGETRDCNVVNESGKQYCFHGESDGKQAYFWGHCVESPECKIGETKSCNFDEDPSLYTTCVFDDDGVPGWDEYGCSTPLVLKFGAAPLAFTSPASAAPFDINGFGRCTTPDWPTSATPWLAIDLNHDGEIDGSELFGSGSILADGHHASNGFLALAELDSNGDGHITPADARYAELVVWADANADRRATPAELQPLAALGVVDIDLHYGARRSCDARGNCGVERASFGFETSAGESRTGEVVDVHLACGDR